MRSSALAVLALASLHLAATGTAAADTPERAAEPVSEAATVQPTRLEAPDAPEVPAIAAPPRGRRARTWETIRGDYSQFYSARGLGGLAAGLVAAGAVANSDADQEAFDWYHGEVGTGADSFADGADRLGEPAVGLGGAALGVALLGLVPEGEGERPAAAWVRRTARAYVVGLPAMYYLQQLVGSGRPDEPEGSQWQVFGETHGVSGHAFLAAVPLLTVVRTSDNRFVQGTALVASLATAWARVHQEEHYPSQAFLGWYLAWSATGAVARADAGRGEPSWALTPVAMPEGGGVVVRASF
jgi:hypothetical protein